MADNVAITAGAGTTVAADDIGSVFHQRVKAGWGADGSYNDPSVANPFPTQDVRGNRMIFAVGSTLTRPANVTAYTAGDSISNHATAASVSALSVTVSDTNDYPVGVAAIEVNSTDTGLAGSSLRVYVFNSDPIASSGVVAGDNAAYSNKLAGFVGSFSGVMRAFSDGSRGVLVPDEGSLLMTLPTSGAKTLYFQYQTVGGFTPSANSTTLIATFRAYQAIP
jgi:hypothetical protein